MNPTKVRFSSAAQKKRMEVYAYAMGFRSVADFLLHAAENYITRNALGKSKEELGEHIYAEIQAKKEK